LGEKEGERLISWHELFAEFPDIAEQFQVGEDFVRLYFAVVFKEFRTYPSLARLLEILRGMGEVCKRTETSHGEEEQGVNLAIGEEAMAFHTGKLRKSGKRVCKQLKKTFLPICKTPCFVKGCREIKIEY
jgi:hypothetical protein